ncbi:MAG: hypothetical protein P1V51_17980 [Deltaproteobacteria bacterium]|nr:hypothetical protein [Deltaproteobacteria bacterium]
MRKKIGEILVEGGLIDDFQLQASLGHQRQWGGRIGEIVVSKGYTTGEAVADALSLQLGLERFQMAPDAVEPKAAKLIALDLAERQKLVPFRLDGERGDVLWIAMSDPTDLATLDEIQFQTGKRIKVATASEAEIRALIAHVFRGAPLPEPAPPPPKVTPIEAMVAEPSPAAAESLQEVEAEVISADSLAPARPAAPAFDPMTASPAAWGAPTPVSTGGLGSDVEDDLAALGMGDDPAPPAPPAPRPATAAPIPVRADSLARPVPVSADSLAPVPVSADSLAPAPVSADSLAPAPVSADSLAPAAVSASEPEPEPEPEEVAEELLEELEPMPAGPAADGEAAAAFADIDLQSAAAIIGNALDKMAAGEALPDQARRYVNPTQMAAALTRLLIRKGIIEETDLIDELQKK